MSHPASDNKPVVILLAIIGTLGVIYVLIRDVVLVRRAQREGREQGSQLADERPDAALPTTTRR